MEKENIQVIDKTQQQLMKIPTFTPCVLATPLQLTTISIKPLPPMSIDSNVLLPQHILDRLGVKQQSQDSIFAGLLNCNSCAACKALSKQTLSEIDQNKDIEQELKQHVNDEGRRKCYEQQWMRLKKHSVKLPRVSFKKYYQQKGHLQADDWKTSIHQLFA